MTLNFTSGKSVLQVLILLLLPALSHGQISIAAFPYSSGVFDFNAYNPTTSATATSTLPSGWSISGAATYDGRGTGSSTIGGAYAFGSGTDYSLGALHSGSSGNIAYSVSFINTSGSAITSLTIAWDYKQWRFANTSGWNCVGTGALAGNTTLEGKDFTGTASGTAGNVTPIASFTLTGLSIANNAVFGITWTATDVTGSDNGVAIDNFSLSAPSPPAIKSTSASVKSFCRSTTATTSVGFTPTALTGTFTAELSNQAGNFISPTATATGTSSPITLSVPSGLAAGTGYRIRVKNGSIIGDTVTDITISAMPVISVQPVDQNLCKGSSIALSVTASPATTYQYFKNNVSLGGAAASNNYIKPNAQLTDGGNYFVKIVNGSCSVNSDTVAVDVSESPSVVISSSPSTICYNGSTSVNFSGTSGATVFYNANGGSNQQIALDSAGDASIPLAALTTNQTYNVISVVNPAGSCINNGGSNTQIHILPQPSVSSFAAVDSLVCPGSATTIHISGTPGAVVTYQVNSIANTVSLDTNGNGVIATGNLNDTTAYELIAIENAAAPTCSTTITGTETIAMKPLPSAMLSPAGPLTLCTGSVVMLTANAGSGLSYDFRKGSDLLIDSGNTVRIQDAGDYTVTVTDAGTGCKAVSDTVSITLTSLATTLPGTGATSVAQQQGDGMAIAYTNNNCEPVATITDPANGTSLGTVTSTVTVTSDAGVYNKQPYVQRQYDITPSGTNGPAVLTLYYLQSEFDNFNSKAQAIGYPLLLPGSPADPNIDNLSITAFHSAGTGGPGGRYDALNQTLIPSSSITKNFNGHYWEISFPVNGFSGFFLSTGNANPLPVSLEQFTALAERQINRLSWNTLTEAAGESMSVERSVNGADFSTIGSVTTTGKAATYVYYDEQPQQGRNFYRLKMPGSNGKPLFSKTVVVLNDAAQSVALNVYPNPAADYLQLQVDHTVGRLQVQILDVAGKELMTTDAAQMGGAWKINVAGLSPGFYILKALINGHTYQARFEKK